MSTDPNILAILAGSSVINTANVGIAKSTLLVQQTMDQQQAQILADQKTIAGLNSQILALAGRKTTIYSNLQSYALFTKDQKIPFQWIQPGNTGNTGGGSPIPHGTSMWAVTPNQPTVITVHPENISPKSDNFFYYMVLPYPTVPPMRMRFTSGNYAAKSAADWGKSQQMENQVEWIGGGYQYTPGWSVHPKLGLQYFDKLNEKWVQFLSNGKPVLVNLGSSTNWMCECTMDVGAHTLTLEWVIIENQFYKVGVTLAANPVNPSLAEFSISVQLDCQAAAPSYSGVLDALTAEWQ